MRFHPKYKIWETCLASSEATVLNGKQPLTQVWVEYVDPPLSDGSNGEMIATDGILFAVVPCTLDPGDVPGQVSPEVLKRFASYFEASYTGRTEGIHIQLGRNLVQIMDGPLTEGSYARSTKYSYDAYFDWRSSFDWDKDYSTHRPTTVMGISLSRLQTAGRVLGVAEDEGVILVGGNPLEPTYIQPLQPDEEDMLGPAPPVAIIMPFFMAWMKKWSGENAGKPAELNTKFDYTKIKLKITHYSQHPVPPSLERGERAVTDDQLPKLEDKTLILTAKAAIEATEHGRSVEQVTQYKPRRKRTKKEKEERYKAMYNQYLNKLEDDNS